MFKRQIAEELHRPRRTHYDRRSVVLKSRDDLFQIDLAEFIPYHRQNKGYKYILFVIDCFTKYSWAVPLKSKRGADIVKAIEPILAKRNIVHVQSDLGKEFYNSKFSTLMKKYNINHYSTYSTLKASICERLIRTIKTKLYRELTAQGSHNWISILNKVMDEYNNSVHRTIKMTPTYADNNPSAVIIRSTVNKTKQKIKFRRGDYVRVSSNKVVFEKGYLSNWSFEIFTIAKVCNTIPVTYLLEDFEKNPIRGCFYEQELQKTKYPHNYLIEKIVRRKGDKVLVRWMGFPSKHDSWMNKNELEK